MTIPLVIHYVVLFSAFAMAWFLVLLILLPIGLGDVDPETGAPLKAYFARKALWSSIIAALLWLIFYFAIRSGWLEL
ncbi:MAG: DUF1467 family protein [Rhizomicrobium sp.]